MYFYLPLAAKFHVFIWLDVFAPVQGSSACTWLYPALRHACQDSCEAGAHPLLFHLLSRFGDRVGRTLAAVVPAEFIPAVLSVSCVTDLQPLPGWVGLLKTHWDENSGGENIYSEGPCLVTVPSPQHARDTWISLWGQELQDGRPRMAKGPVFSILYKLLIRSVWK